MYDRHIPAQEHKAVYLIIWQMLSVGKRTQAHSGMLLAVTRGTWSFEASALSEFFFFFFPE